jgi:hypothetical protein
MSTIDGVVAMRYFVLPVEANPSQGGDAKLPARETLVLG